MRACQDRGGTPHHASMHAQSRACMRNSRPRDSSDQCPPSQQATRSRQQVSVSPESVAALFRSLTPFSSVALSAGTHVRSQQFLAAWGKRGARMGCAFHQTCPRVNLVGACSLFYKKGRAWWKAIRTKTTLLADRPPPLPPCPQRPSQCLPRANPFKLLCPTCGSEKGIAPFLSCQSPDEGSIRHHTITCCELGVWGLGMFATLSYHLMVFNHSGDAYLCNVTPATNTWGLEGSLQGRYS
jgi:hypothetical protein